MEMSNIAECDWMKSRLHVGEFVVTSKESLHYR